MWTFCLLIVYQLIRCNQGIPAADFVSSWKPIAAYTNAEVDINHGLNQLPLKVEVLVKVFDQSLDKDLYFLATGSAQKGNDNSLPFGGVIYVYNNQTIKILAPGPLSCSSPSCTGSLVFLGGKKFSGDRSIITSTYTAGYIRARVWKACSLPRPELISDELTLQSGAYEEIPLSFTRDPSMVIVHVHLNASWVFEAQGSVFYTQSNSPFGGVVFAYSSSAIRIWVPGRGSGTSNANGVPFNAMNGWGNSSNFGYSATVRIRAFVWDFISLTNNPIIQTQTTYLTNSYFTSVPPGHSFQDENKLVILSVKVSTGDNNEFQFDPSGSSMTDGTTDNNTNFGAFIYGYTHDKIYFWVPDSTFSGCVILMGGLWGSNMNAQCMKKSDVALKMTFSYLNIDEPACGDFPCLGSSDRGPECNCTGSGKEGQFCDAGIQCSKPTDFRNASLSPVKNGYAFQEEITFSCNKGYEFVRGTSVRMCQDDKTWAGEAFICSPVLCGVPNNGSYSYMVVKGMYFGNTVLYACLTGYEAISGDTLRTCQADKTWNGSALVCEKSCPASLLEGVIRTNSGNIVNQTGTFGCQSGFTYVNGSSSRLCNTDGTWSGDPYTCTRISCDVPTNITRGRVSYSSTLFESVATYTCDIGYTDTVLGSNTAKVTCDHTSQWVGQIPSCQLVSCPNPPVILNGSRNTSSHYSYGDVVVYKCNIAFKLTGTAERYCQSDATWNGSLPRCDAVTCPQFMIAYGAVHVSSYNVNGFAAVSCNAGFVYSGSYTPRFCLASGSWSGDVPRCINATDQENTCIKAGQNAENKTTLLETDYIYRVEKKSTSAYKRSLISAGDGRSSATVMGWVGCAVLATTIALIMSFDLDKIYQKFTNKKRNNEHFKNDDGT